MGLTKQDRDIVARARRRLRAGPYFVVVISLLILVKAIVLGLLVDRVFSLQRLDPAYQALWTIQANGVLHYGTLLFLGAGFQVLLLAMHRSQIRADRLLVGLVEERARREGQN